MSNVVAGIGRGQLKVLDQRVEKKRAIFNYYKEALKDIKTIQFMPMNDWYYSNCWLSSAVLNGSITPVDLIVALEEHNIESRPLWKPMHLQPFFEKYDFIGDRVSDDLFNRGICLPSDSKMTKEEQDKVISVIRGVLLNA
jgi:dTDP-4-amino-4,6-dideoxygalactose transaminase